MGQVQCVDVLSEELHLGLLDGIDALLVGGSGEYSVLDDVPPIHRFVSFLGTVADAGAPMFASCFGFQALALAMGGEVVCDEDNAEVGSYALELTEEGLRDPLFGALPVRFIAQLGHKDQVRRLPVGVVNLARSSRTPHQAFSLPGKPIYATQFHPELTWLDNRKRFERYMSTYGKLFGKEEAVKRLESHVPSPEANTLLSRFVSQIVSAG